METEQKIDKINELNRQIESLKEFLNHMNRGNKVSSYSEKNSEKRDEFSTLSLSVYIWTGSQNPNYVESICDVETINLIVENSKPLVEMRIKVLELELDSLLK